MPTDVSRKEGWLKTQIRVPPKSNKEDWDSQVTQDSSNLQTGEHVESWLPRHHFAEVNWVDEASDWNYKPYPSLECRVVVMRCEDGESRASFRSSQVQGWKEHSTEVTGGMAGTGTEMDWREAFQGVHWGWVPKDRCRLSIFKDWTHIWMTKSGRAGGSRGSNATASFSSQEDEITWSKGPVCRPPASSLRLEMDYKLLYFLVPNPVILRMKPAFFSLPSPSLAPHLCGPTWCSDCLVHFPAPSSEASPQLSPPFTMGHNTQPSNPGEGRHFTSAYFQFPGL